MCLYEKHSARPGARVARGCATKRPMLYVECEAHKSKSVLEEFCYCSYDLCNTALASRIDRQGKYLTEKYSPPHQEMNRDFLVHFIFFCSHCIVFTSL